MLSKLLIAWTLMSVCVVIHATGLAGAGRWLRRRAATPPQFWAWTRLFVRWLDGSCCFTCSKS